MSRPRHSRSCFRGIRINSRITTFQLIGRSFHFFGYRADCEDGEGGSAHCENPCRKVYGYGIWAAMTQDVSLRDEHIVGQVPLGLNLRGRLFCFATLSFRLARRPPMRHKLSGTLIVSWQRQLFDCVCYRTQEVVMISSCHSMSHRTNLIRFVSLWMITVISLMDDPSTLLLPQYVFAGRP